MRNSLASQMKQTLEGHFKFVSYRRTQEGQEGCGCFWDLVEDLSEEKPGKNSGKLILNREVAQILGFRASGKANLPVTLG